MQYNILIIDDEKPARQELSFLISNILKDYKLFEASSGEEALRIIKSTDIDIAFVDINMQDIDGITLSRKIYNINNDIKIVFATAYDAYAVKAFEVNAIDYILKPFEQERVELTIRRIDNNQESTKPFVVNNEKKVKKICLYSEERVLLVDIDDIVYIETDERNSLVKTVNGVYSTNQNIGYFDKKLEGESFFRVHRSFLINLQYVKEILPWFNGTYIVKVNKYEKDEIPVSRKKIKDFKAFFEL